MGMQSLPAPQGQFQRCESIVDWFEQFALPDELAATKSLQEEVEMYDLQMAERQAPQQRGFEVGLVRGDSMSADLIELAGLLEPLQQDEQQVPTYGITMMAGAGRKRSAPNQAPMPKRHCSEASSCSTSSVASSCSEMSQSSATSRGRKWTKSEDKLLMEAVEKHNARNWKAIARSVPGRDHVQCMQRWQKVLDPRIRKGPWTREEDDILREQVRINGANNWAQVAASIKGRTYKQCRERWTTSVDPTIKRGPWSRLEDHTLLSLHKSIGNRWADMRRELPGRTENAIKTRFKTLQKAFVKDDEVVWTPELSLKLDELADKYNGDLLKVQRHLPVRLRGISTWLLVRQCPSIKWD